MNWKRIELKMNSKSTNKEQKGKLENLVKITKNNK